MRDLKELNLNEGGRPVTRLAPTDKLVEVFQLQTGRQIPSDLLALLKFANGGHHELDSVGGITGQFAVNTFYNLCADDFGVDSLWYAVLHWGPVLGENALPFANDGGGNQFFLDLSTKPPRVKIFLHDRPENVVDVSASFEDFIDSLASDPDMV